jgi:hypothetical protein
MTALAMHVPALLDPPPPIPREGDGDGGGQPAPGATILAVLGRVASHAGDPLSVTVTAPTHAITVNVDGRDPYIAWCRELVTDDTIVSDDQLGVLARSTSRLHGWSLTVQIASPA